MSFTVTVQPSGRRFQVEAGETVLDAALRQGLTFPYGCRSGVCGACKGKILAGEVDYPGHEGLPPALDEAEAAAGLALFCVAVPKSDLTVHVAEVGAVADIPVRTLPCRVARMERLAEDVMRLWLRLPEGQRLQYLAGQYIDILLADGRRRGFSLANPPEDDALLELHIRRVPGGYFTGHVFTRMKEGDLLRFEGPHGTFFLREEGDRPIVMVAGGTGFAPMKAMIEHARHIGLSRPIHLYWGARDRDGLYLHALPQAWQAEMDHFHYVPVLSQPRDPQGWSGRVGLVTEAVAADWPDLSGVDLYMAGPPAMVAAGRTCFLERGLPEDRLFYDAFEFASDKAGS